MDRTNGFPATPTVDDRGLYDLYVEYMRDAAAFLEPRMPDEFCRELIQQATTPVAFEQFTRRIDSATIGMTARTSLEADLRRGFVSGLSPVRRAAHARQLGALFS